jgi:signal transduction histidine kinase
MEVVLRTERKVQAGFAFALALLSVIGALSYRSVVRLREDRARVVRSHEVIGSMRLLLSIVTDAEAGMRGYTVTGQESYLVPHDDALRSLEGELQRLRTLTAGDADRQRHIGVLTGLIAARMNAVREIVALRRDLGFEAARAAISTGRGKEIQLRIRELVADMEMAEEVLLRERDVTAERSSALTRTVIVAGSVVAFGFVGLALFFIGQDFSGRERADAALREANDQLEARVRDRTAEVQRLNAELEQRVVDRTAQLEAANKELEAFSYSVSHDLRAPLRAVDGFSQALLEDFGSQLPEEGQRQVRTIREGAQRMGALIDDLLAFARLGRQALVKPVVVDMDRLVRETLEDLLPERQGRQVEIRAAALPPSNGDNALLKQVWANLLSNALKYTRKRDRAVVEIGSVLADGETVYFVRDNGAGFDMRYAHKLFGVFQRLHRAEDFEGSGVGLAIVQRIVKRHGGRAWAEAAVDRGATFHFTIPGGAAS